MKPSATKLGLLGMLGIMTQLLLASPASAIDPECTLNCPIDAPCKFGESATVGDHSHKDGALTLDGMHCDCPPGWTGVMCDRKYESCHVTPHNTGHHKDTHHCYHSGKCVSGFLDRYGNDQTYCDCSEAASADGTRFTGKYCETPVTATATCDPDDDNHFCVHSSTCNTQYKTSGGTPCFCAAGYQGEHCEFRIGEMPECTLDCGEGRCVVGLRSPEEMDKIGDIWSEKQIHKHMRCECPDGTGGLSCEASATVCGHDGTTTSNDGKHKHHHTSHTCYHGSTCLKTEVTHSSTHTEIRYHCDCTTAADAANPHTKFAGANCQFPSSQDCSNDSFVDSENFFCVNGGQCPQNPLGDCSCTSDFTGPKCERPTKRNDDKENDAGTDGVVADGVGSNPPEPVQCGSSLVCHNGGTCRSGQTGYYCDCANAFTEDTIFAGEQCEFPSTIICNDPPADVGMVGAYFCTNNGSCNMHHVEAGCRCSRAFEGMHCEFEINSGSTAGDVHVDVTHPGENVTSACGSDLKCLHGSACVENADGSFECDCAPAQHAAEGIFYAGDKCEFRANVECPSSSAVPFCVNGGKCPTGGQDTCKCHDGFTGDQCQLLTTDDPTQDQDPTNDNVEPCGDTHCFNGGKCVGRQGAKYCDCSQAFDGDHLFAGDSCQYPSTVVCNADEVPDTLQGLHFCTNHGRCGKNEKHKCKCGVNWTGKHCEFHVHDVEEDHASEPQHPDSQICGTHKCHNGAICRDSDTDAPYCDCITANQNPGIFYAGDKCQYPSTLLCDNGSFCTNGGKCKPNGEMGCTCHSGWTGEKCEIEISVDEAVKDAPPAQIDDFEECAPGHYCYFGGTCMAGDVHGDTTYECDCSTAVDQAGGHLYSGKFCQYQSTSICVGQAPNSSFEQSEFCVNGGRCRTGKLGCDCPTGYTGLRCEATMYDVGGDAEDNIRPGDDSDDAPTPADPSDVCELECFNGGVCKEGTKDLGALEDTTKHVDHLNKTHQKERVEHCVCPEGYTGLTCKHKVETCGKNEHHCLHGSQCVSNKGEHSCDCATADDKLDGENQYALFSGDSCQHEATDICTTGEPVPGRPLHFCVNEGKCKSYVAADKPHPGCNCADGWTGDDCEVRVGSEQATERAAGSGDDSDSVGMAAIVIATIVAVIAIILAVVILMRSRSNDTRDDSATCMQLRRRRKNRFQGSSDQVNLAPKRDSTFRPLVKDAAPISPNSDPMAAGLALEPDDEPEVYLGPPRDEDGHELHNVDII